MAQNTDPFQFPVLGSTGEGPILHEGRQGELLWTNGYEYYVSLQEDHPACAFRCHYPGGSAPCDEVTARRFIRWVKQVTQLPTPS